MACLLIFVCGAGVLLLSWWVVREHSSELDDVGYTQAVVWTGTRLYLPADATHISAYERTGGLQFLLKYYCFTVAPARVEAVVDEVTSLCEKEMKKSLSYTRSDVSSATRTWDTSAKAFTPWWKPETITLGIYKGAGEAYAVQVWADKTSGKVYVYQSD